MSSVSKTRERVEPLRSPDGRVLGYLLRRRHRPPLVFRREWAALEQASRDGKSRVKEQETDAE